MYEQRGSFSGLDTCNHVEFGRFDCHSVLRHEVEDRAISNRYDVNCHLDVLCGKNIISSEMVNTMRNSAKVFSEGNKLKKYYYGATYIPMNAAIAFQKDIIDRMIGIQIDAQNGNGGIIIKCNC